MFELIFGIIWTAITLVFAVSFFGIFFVAGGASSMGNMILIPIIMVVVFLIIGIIVLRIGFKKYKKNKNTDKYGEECYALVECVTPTNYYVNNQSVYETNVVLYVQSSGTVLHLSEQTGTNPSKYSLGSFVKVKYYDGDINFMNEEVNPEFMPTDIKERLEKEKKYVLDNNQIINDGNPEEITMNGVVYSRYKRPVVKSDLDDGNPDTIEQNGVIYYRTK